MFQPVHELPSEAEVEALFIGVRTALCVTIILDGVDKLPEGYRIRSHDSFGSLPNIEIDSTHNMEQVLDRISLSTASSPWCAWGLHDNRGVARRQRCTRIASSSRLALAVQAPCARPIVLSPRAARLGATVRFRRELAMQTRDCKFIVPTSTGKVAMVGIRTGGRTVRARGVNECQAYQKLNKKMTELSLQAA
jgi:hypothetical protein